MADEKDRVWLAFSQLIQRKAQLKQPLSIPRLGTFAYTQDRLPLFLPADDLDKAEPLPSSPPDTVLDLGELAEIAGIPVERTRNLLEESLEKVRKLGKPGNEDRKRLPGLGEFVGKDGVLVFLYERPASKGWELPFPLDWKRPPKSPSLSSRSSASCKALISPRVEFLLHNQAKLLIALQQLDKERTGFLPFAKVCEAVSMLDNPLIQPDTLRSIVNASEAETEGQVDYRKLLFGLSRYRAQRTAETASSFPSPRTDYTANYDANSVLPLLRKIWEKRLIVVEFGHKGGMRPRIKTSSSELLSLLKKAGIRVNLHQLHAVLREGQFDPASVSLLDIIDYSRRTLQETASDLSSIREVNSEEGSRARTPTHPDEFLAKIRLFFRTFSIEEVVRLASNAAGLVSCDRFVAAVTEVGGGRVRAADAQRAFLQATAGKNVLPNSEIRAIFQPQATKMDTQSHVFRLLRDWLRREKLTSEQAFEQLLAQAGGSTETLDRAQLATALQAFAFNSFELEMLFQALDTKQDQVVDLAEWCNKVYEENGPYQSLRDVILSHQLSTEDLLIRMNVGNKQRLSAEELAAVLQTMDASLSAMKAVEIASVATHRHGYVDVQSFLHSLSQEVPPYEGDWKTHIYKRIQNKIKGKPQELREKFERADTKHSGKLGLADFQDCVYRAEVGLEPLEIERLARVLDRDNSHQIDYTDFLAHLKGPNLPQPDPLKLLTERLLIFLNQNAMTPATLLKRLGGRATPQAFADFLALKVQKNLARNTLLEAACKLDLNQDGFIDLEDLTAALSNRSRLSLAQPKTYPTEPLSKSKAREVLKILRHAFIQRRVNFADAFRMLDKSNTGMLTALDWSEGLNRFVDLSNPVKDGFFAAMDTKGIGLIDYQTFLRVLKDGEMEDIGNKDSWHEEERVLARVRQWIQDQEVSIEAAFRAFDRDFDGVISKSDLRESLKALLNISELELPSSKLDRLYKLLDCCKRDSVQLADFKAVIEHPVAPQWKQSARQQLGLLLSRSFPDISTSFESISQFAGKLTFAQFQSYIQQRNALAGFNLTAELLQQLFADMDMHRKGYLTLQDWTLAFAAHRWKEQHYRELTDAMRVNFGEVRRAFEYFQGLQSAGKVTLDSFSRGVQKLVPKRFSNTEIAEIWEELAGTESEASFSRFERVFGGLHYTATTTQSSQRLSHTSPSFLTKSSSRFPSVLSEDNPLKQFYTLLGTDAGKLETAFRVHDSGATGVLTLFEFRQAIRSLGLGLSARDIDRLISVADSLKNGNINWRELLTRCKATEAEIRIRQVAQQRLTRIRENMFEYMLSPGDAFQQADESRTNRISFPQFTSLVRRLCELAKDEEPAFPVLKDLFELIDTRKDGVLDQKEWSNAFKPAGGMQNWEDSQHFGQVCAGISRSRKMLTLAFEALAKENYVSSSQAREVLSMALKGVRLQDWQWKRLVRIAEKPEGVDYRLLLDVCKERSLAHSLHPKPAILAL